MSDTRRRLDELLGGRRTPGAEIVRRELSVVRRSLADVVGGAPKAVGTREYWHIEAGFDAVCAHGLAADSFGRVLVHHDTRDGRCEIEPRKTLIFDIETGGFTGTPVFLIGVVLLDQRPLRVIQLFARDYPEEQAIVEAFASLAADRDTWISFNGRSFDAPFLHDRATLHRVHLDPPRLHVDLLHAARRQWRDRLPNCRLTTLETQVLGRPRVGDVPSSDVPDLFHHFMRTANAGPLRPVIVHNQIDLVSSAELLARLTT